MTQVESHLKECEACAGMYKLQILADKVMKQEKDLQPEPFLATRIMAGIDNLKDSRYIPATALRRVLNPAMVTASLAAAVFFGIMLGNLSRPSSNRQAIPMELALIDDATIESVNILSNE